jgi:hypothetical protein
MRMSMFLFVGDVLLFKDRNMIAHEIVGRIRGYL